VPAGTVLLPALAVRRELGERLTWVRSFSSQSARKSRLAC
jgi:hypothetical protein